MLSGEDLEIELQPTLGETLSSEPGISSTYFDPGASRPVIRGLGGDRVRAWGPWTRRAPARTTANELYADRPHLATRTFEVGNPGLGEEIGLGLDASLRKRQGRVTGVVSLFFNRFDDFIFERLTGDVEDGLDVVRFAQEDAEFRGGEIDAVVELAGFETGHLELLLGADFVDAELRRTGENLPRIPPWSTSVGLNLHYGHLRSTLEVERVATQNDVAARETPTGGYTLVHASTSYRLLTKGFVADLLLRGRNLTNQEARHHASFLKNEVPLPGRDLTLWVRLKF